jgi:predicted small metal-binding protein
MTRELRCAELIPGCDFVAQGTRDSEVMQKTAEHAKRAHRMVAIAMEVERRARAAIRDVAV